MVEQIPTPDPSTALEKLQEQLTCPVCLSQFDGPKTLPCLHSFCLKCIQQLPVNLEKGKHRISCPTCRKMAQVPDKGPAELPTAFLINSFIEIQEQLKKLSAKGKQISCENCKEGDAASYCTQCAIRFCEMCLAIHNEINTKHQIVDMKNVTVSKLLSVNEESIMDCTDHNEPLKVLCETCQKLICQSCTIRHHKDHDYDIVSDIFPKHQQDIQEVLQVVANKILALQDAMTAIAKREEDIAKQRDDRIKEIHLQVQGIMELVMQAGERLEGEVNRVAECKLQLLGQQKEEAELALVQLKSCKDFVEKGLEVGSQQQILSEKKSMIEGMEVVSTQINPDIFRPVEKANITFTRNEELVESCINIGEVEFFSFTDNHNVKFSGPTSSMAGRKVTATLNLQTKLGSPYKIPPSLPLTCHLISGDIIVCGIEETKVGQYSISFTPSARGKHQLRIQVGGIDINGSPIALRVLPSPEMRGKPVKVISGFSRPWGVAIDKKGQLMVTEYNNHCITVCDEEGKVMQSFGSEGAKKDQFTKSEFKVADQEEDQYRPRAVALSSYDDQELEALHLCMLRSEGTKEGQLTSPRGVAVTNDGHILVTDQHRLQKLTPEGHCVMSVGTCSSESIGGPLQFKYPTGVALHPITGQIYVADHCNHRIQVINGDFTYSHSIGIKGTAPGQMNHPYDVALDSVGNIYVANRDNDCIDVFTSDGNHLRQFGSKGSGDGQLNFPTSITIDAQDMVYVAEGDNHRVSIFTTDGVFIRHIGHEGSGEDEFNSPRGITVDMLGNLYVSDYYNSRVVIL